MIKLTEMPHPVSDRSMTMRIPLTKDRNATIVNAYALAMANPEENKEAFYSQLKGTLRNIHSTDTDKLLFKQKDAHKTTWTHPRSQHGHVVDFMLFVVVDPHLHACLEVSFHTLKGLYLYCLSFKDERAIQGQLPMIGVPDVWKVFVEH